MPLSDPLNGVYRAGYAYQQKSYSDSGNLTITPASQSATLTLTIPQMLDAVTLSYSAQFIISVNQEDFVVDIAKNGVIIASYGFSTNLFSLPLGGWGGIICDAQVPIFGGCFAGETYTLTFHSGTLSGLDSMTINASISVIGSPI